METKEVKKRKSDEKHEKLEKSALKEASSNNTNSDSEDEIDLTELIRKIWADRKVIFIGLGIAFVLGIFIAMISPEEYEASTTLLPESSGNSNSRGSSLLRQFGIFDLGISGGTTSLGTNMYPNITQSTPFYLYLMDQELYFSSLDSTVTIFQYFSEIKEKPLIEDIKRYTIGLPGLLLALPDRLAKKPQPVNTPVSDSASNSVTINEVKISDKPLQLSGPELSVINELKSRITTEIQEDGTVTVTTKMPDPYATAQLTELAVAYLTQYVTEYRIEKVLKDLEFTENQYEEAKKRFNAAQEKLALFSDRNTNMVTARAQTELERLQTEYNLASEVYLSLAQQLEQAKIKVQEETPIFKELEPVQIPLSESEPNRKLIILAFIFLGGVIGFGIIFAKVFISYIKDNFSLNA